MTSSSVTRPKLPVPITEKGVVDVSVTAHGDGGENITIDLAKGVQHHDGDTAIRKAHHRTSTKRHIKGVRPSRCAILERCNSAFGVGKNSNHHADVAGDNRGESTNQE